MDVYTLSPMHFHPWAHLRQLAHITLQFRADMPEEYLAVTDGTTIWMREGQLQRERRSTLTHELVHLERGEHSVCGGRGEEDVRQESARRLIPIRALADALRWTTQIEEAADHLWVDRDTLETRLRHLHPAEVALLKRATEHHGDVR